MNDVWMFEANIKNLKKSHNNNLHVYYDLVGMILNINKEINMLIPLFAFKTLLESFTFRDIPLGKTMGLMEKVKK